MKAAEEFRRQAFVAMCKSHGLPVPIPEYRFDAERRWRLDWAFGPERQRVALEIQGGIFTGGRHVRGAALLREMEKLNAAAVAGFRVLFCTPEQVTTGEIFPVLKAALEI